MSRITSDAAHTSAKLRNKAMEIIKKTGRPMAASEIEVWLRAHDHHLWKDISSKCEDYVRIILSLTRETSLLKYKPIRPIQGIDKRSTFFGLASVQYPEDQWKTFTPRPTHKQNQTDLEQATFSSGEEVTYQEEPIQPRLESDPEPIGDIFSALSAIFDNVTIEDESWFSF